MVECGHIIAPHLIYPQAMGEFRKIREILNIQAVGEKNQNHARISF
jgi:hypothetical protein